MPLIGASKGRLRQECPSQNRIVSIDDARQQVESLQRHYNEDRPHTAWGTLALRELAVSTGPMFPTVGYEGLTPRRVHGPVQAHERDHP